MDRGVNDNLKFNQETEFVPILGLVANQLNAFSGSESKNSSKVSASSNQENHHPALLSVLAEELSVVPEEIHDFELYVYFHTFWSNGSLTIGIGLSTMFNHRHWEASTTNSSSVLVVTISSPRKQSHPTRPINSTPNLVI